MSYPVRFIKFLNDNNNNWPQTEDGHIVEITIETPENTYVVTPLSLNIPIKIEGTFNTPLVVDEYRIYDNIGHYYRIVSQSTVPGSNICLAVIDPTY